MKIFSLRYFLILLSWCITSVNSQQYKVTDISQYVRQEWQTEDGLPQNSITSITQTPDGYMWFGSQSGLIRFDGVSFNSFYSGNTDGINGDDVWALKTDSKGRMWIGTNGTGLICYKNGKFKTFDGKNEFIESGIWCIFEDSKNNIWIGTGGGGIYIYDGSKFKKIDTSNGLSNNFIWTIIEDKSGDIWIGTDGGFINRIHNNVIEVYNQSVGYPGSYTMAGLAASDNSLWFGAAGTGLVKYMNGKFTAYTPRNGLANDIVWSILEDRKKNLWIGTDNGISKLSNGEFTSFKEEDGLLSNTVSALFEDNEGNIWAGIKGGGITKFREGVISTFTTHQGLPNNNVYSILKDTKSNIWFCTNKGLYRIDKNLSGKQYSYKDGLTADVITTVCEGHDGRIWVGSDGAGVYLLENNKFKNYNLASFVPRNTVLSMYEDSKGTLWMGTDGYGIISLANGKLDWWTMGNGLSGEFISCIYEDSNGSIWAGTSDGTGLNKMLKDTIQVYTIKDGLLANDIWSINEDKEKALWITTPKGLNKIKNGRIYSYSYKQGLPKVQFYSIVEDNYGYYWMSSNAGIYRISKDDVKKLDAKQVAKIGYISFGISDGMKSAQCSRGNPASAVTKEGYIWFPTIKGAVLIDPAKVLLNKIIPPVIIEKVEVNGKNINSIKINTFSPGSGDVEFDFTALSYAAIEKVKIKYKLDGWDDDWKTAGSKRSAYYTNLPPGKYKFRVIASNDAGIWNYSGAVYAFELQPHFYQTYWFYLLVSLLFAGGIVTLFKMRVKKIKQNELLLESKILERTKELEKTNVVLSEEIDERKQVEEKLQTSLQEKEVMLKEIHHRVKNNLQVINSLLYLNSRKIKDKDVLSIFEESQSRIKSIAMVHERLYQCKNLGEIELHEHIRQLTREIFLTYASKYVDAKIELDIQNVFVDIDVAVPCSLIINEIVSNSFKYAFPEDFRDKEKIINIRIERISPQKLLIEICDNGIGFPPDIEKKKKNTLGLHLVESLVKQLNGSYECSSNNGTEYKIIVKG